MSVGEAHHLIEDREGITHTTIRLLGDHVECLWLRLDPLARGDIGQVFHHVSNADAIEIINLTAGKDGREHLMLLRRGQDEERMMGRLLQCLQESIESRCRQHVHLINDEYLVLADGRRDAYLIDQRTNIIHRVVARRIQLMDIIRALLVEGTARLAFVTSLPIRRRMQTVDRLSEGHKRSFPRHEAHKTDRHGPTCCARSHASRSWSTHAALLRSERWKDDISWLIRYNSPFAVLIYPSNPSLLWVGKYTNYF